MSQVFTASSPGRLDVMGGIADYSGSLVLQMPIQNKTTVSISLRDDYQCTLKSRLPESVHEAIFNYRTLLHENYEGAHQKLTQNQEEIWIAYIIGSAFILQKEKGIDFRGGDFTVESEIPLGKGVSSSAALEVATMKALCAAFNLNLNGTELPVLAQRVENQIVGAPCGLMDQLSSYFGEDGKLLPIICQPDKLHTPIVIPNGIHFIGIDSGVRHSVSGASYADVRCAAFMGYSIIAQHLGVLASTIKQARETGIWNNLPYQGYLCNIEVKEFEAKFKSILPTTLSGQEFLNRYGYTTDAVTQIKENVEYHIWNCTSHPIYENERVKIFKQTLLAFNEHSTDYPMLNDLGDLMYESHASYSACGLGSEGTDALVTAARTYQDRGIAGAKITGGGSGGTVCLLAIGDEGKKSAKKIHQMMESKTRKKLAFFE